MLYTFANLPIQNLIYEVKVKLKNIFIRIFNTNNTGGGCKTFKYAVYNEVKVQYLCALGVQKDIQRIPKYAQWLGKIFGEDFIKELHKVFPQTLHSTAVICTCTVRQKEVTICC